MFLIHVVVRGGKLNGNFMIIPTVLRQHQYGRGTPFNVMEIKCLRKEMRVEVNIIKGLVLVVAIDS